jgi:hypothetical protein
LLSVNPSAFDLSEFKSVRLVFASRENLNPLACADIFLNGLAEQNERGDFVISGYLHLSLGTKAPFD